MTSSARDFTTKESNKSKTTVLFAGMLSATASAALAGVIYVKPAACGTGDGSSWANAKGNIQACVAAATAGDEFRLSEGIHPWAARIKAPNVAFSIVGGYAGVNDDELPDPDVHRTVISGDVNNDDQWVVYNLRERAYGKNAHERVLGPVIRNGALYLPDGDLTDPDEIATIDITTKSTVTGKELCKDNVALIESQGAPLSISGIWFVGAGQVGSTVGAALNSFSGTISIEDCHFIGCYGGDGVIQLNGVNQNNRTAFKNLEFKWNVVTTRGIFRNDASNFTAENIRIIGGLQTGGQGSCAFFLHGGSGYVIRDFYVERCYGAGSNYGPSAGVGAENANKVTMENGVFRNCWANGASGATAAINTRYLNNNKGMLFRNILFDGNCCVVKKTSGTLNNYGIAALGHDGATLENCTFLDNVVDCVPSSACKTVYAAPVMATTRDGSAEAQPYRNILNCTFKGNDVTFSSGDNGANLMLAGAVMVYTPLSGNPIDTVIANCTFAGGNLPDVRWTGVDTTVPAKVLNCIFWKNGDASAYTPFVSDTMAMLDVRHCVMNGYSALPAGVLGENNSFMDPLLSNTPEYVAGYLNPVLRASARVPGLKSAIDFREFIKDNQLYLCYATDPVAHVSSATTAISGDTAFADAVGAPRPAGASTVGAAQALSASGETGYTFAAAVTPNGAGTMTGGATVQVIPPGDDIAPVTAVSANPEKYTFLAWKDANGTIISTEATLALTGLAADQIVTAVFSAPPVTYTFNLGNAGTFTASGATVASVTVTPGDPVVVPAFTVDDEHVVPYGWTPAVPAVAGVENQDFTFDYLEKMHRIVRVDTNKEGEGGDGSSWANAMTDIQAAIDKAGLWTGEVWIRQGVHKVGANNAARLSMKNNVAIMGGFEGVDGKYADQDAERAARDFEAYRTILTGDTGLDDTWVAGKLSGATADIKDDGQNLKVIDGATLVIPDIPEGYDYIYHKAANNNNCALIFEHSSASLNETAVLDGLTVTGGQVMDNPITARPLIRNCFFLGAAWFLTDDAMRFENCTFMVGNVAQAIYVENLGVAAGSTAWTECVDCVFTNCYTTSRGAFATQNARARLTGCVFHGCKSKSRNAYYAAAVGAEQGLFEARNCLFEENLMTNGYSVCCFSNGGNAMISNCVFVANRAIMGKGTATDTYPLDIVRTYQNTAVYRECSFVSNVVSKTVDYSNANNTKSGQACVVYCLADGDVIANCTFEGNKVEAYTTNASYPAMATTVGYGTTGGGIVNCTFNNNETADGDVGLYLRTGTVKPVKVINSVCWDKDDGYSFATVSGTVAREMTVLNSVIKNFDASAAFIAAAESVTAAAPSFLVKLYRGEDGSEWQYARMPGGLSSAKKAGRNVYLNGATWYYPVDASESSFANCASAAAVNAPSVKVQICDIFGQERPLDKFTAGSCQNTSASGFFLILR